MYDFFSWLKKFTLQPSKSQCIVCGCCNWETCLLEIKRFSWRDLYIDSLFFLFSLERIRKEIAATWEAARGNALLIKLLRFVEKLQEFSFFKVSKYFAHLDPNEVLSRATISISKKGAGWWGVGWQVQVSSFWILRFWSGLYFKMCFCFVFLLNSYRHSHRNHRGTYEVN